MQFILRSLNFLQSAASICLIFFMACMMAQASLPSSGSETADVSSVELASRMFTTTEERALGERLAYCYALRHRQVYDEQYRQRIERVASRLQWSVGATKLQVAVIKDERFEAVSFPGGKIFITTGLLEGMRDDDELASVLAHEAALCFAHHTLRLISQALNLPPEERLGFPTREQIITGAVINFRFPPLLNGSAEAYEREADYLAVN